MPKLKYASTERPHYIDENGFLDITKKWQPTPKQLSADCMWEPQQLHVGGIRSGKTAGRLMRGIIQYLLRYPKCNMLVLRRTFPELKAGPIEDFREHTPPEIYTYNQSEHVATFINGSRLVFGHCKNPKDVEQYLGTAYPYIVVDECAQFPPEAWDLLMSRNTPNPECLPDKTQPCGGCGKKDALGQYVDCGYPCMPVPLIVGCTNPFGPYWDWYHSMFVRKEPYAAPDGARRDRNGRYWNMEDPRNPVLLYNPDNYSHSHSTVLDNPHVLAKDPGFIERLNMLPPAKRDKMLLGYMEGGTGQYFDCFDSENVINLREDPDAIIWETWQPVWAGWDWAIGSHWNTVYFFTKAKVRVLIPDKSEPGKFTTDYRTKTVCFKEYVTQNKLDREMANWIASTLRYPNGQPCNVVAIYFSHEKFARQVEQHSPADQLSAELISQGLCPVQPATRNRVGRASLMYQMLAHRELVILDTCTEIIKAIPNLMRDEKIIDDVFKPQGANKPDDCYDGFSYGLYGYFNQKEKPGEMREQERLDSMSMLDRHFAKWKNTIRRQRRADAPRHRPLWKDRLED